MTVRKYRLGDIFALIPQEAQMYEHGLCDEDEDKYLSQSYTITFEHDSVIYAIYNVSAYFYSLIISKHIKNKMVSVFRQCKKEVEKPNRDNLKMIVVDGFKQGKRFAEMLCFKQTGKSTTLNNVKYNIYERGN